MIRRSPLTLVLAPVLALALALGACGGDDDGDDDAAETTTSTTQETTTVSEPSTTDEDDGAGSTSEPADPSTEPTDPPSTETTVPGSGPDDPSPPAPACVSRQVAIAVVQGQSSAFSDASVSDLSCYDDWAVAGLVVDGAPAGFAYLRHSGGGWSLGLATPSLDEGCDYAVAQGAPAPVLADCP